MLADTTQDNTIVYMNDTARDFFARFRNQLNENSVTAPDVTNADHHSIHQFHPDPARIRRILADRRWTSRFPRSPDSHRRHYLQNQNLSHLG